MLHKLLQGHECVLVREVDGGLAEHVDGHLSGELQQLFLVEDLDCLQGFEAVLTLVEFVLLLGLLLDQHVYLFFPEEQGFDLLV